MYLNHRGISRVVAVCLQVLGVAMIPSVIVGLFYKEIYLSKQFLIYGFILYALGLVLLRVIKPSTEIFKIRDGFLVVISCWLVSGLVGAVPYYFSGYLDGFIDCFFESISGLTTTGATGFYNVEVLPRTLLFWRAFSEWIGGFGVVFIPIALLPALGIDGYSIVRAEMSGTIVNKTSARLSDTARTMLIVITSLTLLETVLLMFGGLSFFDALTHSFTTMSTGGFSNYNDSIGHFGSIYVYIIFTIFMFMGGMDVTNIVELCTGQFKTAFKEPEPRYFLALLGISTALITVYLMITGSSASFGKTLTHCAFHVMSTLTTAGYYSADFDFWPIFPKLILLCLMFIGGCISSSAGGIKVFRFVIFCKLIKRGVMLRLHPNGVFDIKVANRKVSSEVIQTITGFLYMYIGLLVIGTAIMTLSGIDTLSAFMAVVACINNVGPALSLGGTILHYGLFSGFFKLVLCFLMLAGRLELTTVVVLFSRNFWNPNRSK